MNSDQDGGGPLERENGRQQTFYMLLQGRKGETGTAAVQVDGRHGQENYATRAHAQGDGKDGGGRGLSGKRARKMTRERAGALWTLVEAGMHEDEARMRRALGQRARTAWMPGRGRGAGILPQSRA